MATNKITAKDLKSAASKAAAGARKRAGELLVKAKGKAGAASKALREMKHRRMVDAGEVLGGAVVAGAAHGAGLSVDWGDGMPDVPAGVPGGIAAIALGVWADSYDAQSVGLGALAFGLGRMAEDFTADKLAQP